jgi:hypothetical protein
MRKKNWIILAVGVALSAGLAWAHESREAQARRSGDSMNGCADMMAGGGMMGGGMMSGSQPNERWRSSPAR